MPLISASRMPARRSVTACPSRFSIRCTNSSTLPGRLAAEAVIDPLAEVHRAAGLPVVVEGAQDLHLLALPDRFEVVVGEDGAEVRAIPKVFEVNTSVVSHLRYYLKVTPRSSLDHLQVASNYVKKSAVSI